MLKVCSTTISDLGVIRLIETTIGCRVILAARDVITLVDADDHERLCGHFWYINPSGYVARNRTNAEKAADGRNGPIFLHRVVIGDPAGLEVDHVSGFKLDNRKCNLRACTPTQNRANTPLRRDNTTGYKGVYYSSTRGKYRAQLRLGDKSLYLGRFDNPVDAAKAYDKAAREHFGEFAQVNFPEAA